MLININNIYGRKLSAIDGLIGHVRDFYFDDVSWIIRYLVADTGKWLPGRQVLLSRHALENFEEHDKTLKVRLHIKQIEASPSIESHKPVSRQFEERYHQYYAWPAYWQGPQVWGMSSYPIVMPPEDLSEYARSTCNDIHLRSAKAVAGYKIEAVDGTIGHITGYMLHCKSWAIRELVVETGAWHLGKELYISLSEVGHISYDESKVHVKMTKADIERTGEAELAKAGTPMEESVRFTD
jgi:hypothetical protein